MQRKAIDRQPSERDAGEGSGRITIGAELHATGKISSPERVIVRDSEA